VDINRDQLTLELQEAGYPFRAANDGDTVYLVGVDGRIYYRADWPEGVADVVDAHVPEDPVPTENQILLSIYQDLDPGADEYAQIQHLIIMQMLQES
jgi:hypothetical protein